MGTITNAVITDNFFKMIRARKTTMVKKPKMDNILVLAVGNEDTFSVRNNSCAVSADGQVSASVL
jgi:hypothetical protein